MANGWGGKRPNSGRKTLKFGFRAWCREVVSDPEVQAKIKQRAADDPDFALKLAEHGFGRPPQSLDVTVGTDATARRTIRLGGLPVDSGVTGVPGADVPLLGDGGHDSERTAVG